MPDDARFPSDRAARAAALTSPSNPITLGPDSPLAGTTGRPKGTKRFAVELGEERNLVVPLYERAGCAVYCNSQVGKPIGVTPGIADLTLFAPGLGIMFFHETKPETGNRRQSKAQRDFQLECVGTDTAYILGPMTSALAFLRWLGIAGEGVGLHIPIRRVGIQNAEERRAWKQRAADWNFSLFAMQIDERYGYQPPDPTKPLRRVPKGATIHPHNRNR